MESVVKAEPISFSAMESTVKAEPMEAPETSGLNIRPSPDRSNPVSVIELSSSGDSSDTDSDDDSSDGADSSSKKSRASTLVGDDGGRFKKRRFGDQLPLGFLDPLPPDEDMPFLDPEPISRAPPALPMHPAAVQGCKQFWKAGDYEGDPGEDSTPVSAGIDHVRVHPKFLHSNATSHKWALGAFAELLDNSLDEICNGATYVKVDMLQNNKDGSKMLSIEDNGGGMDPDKMRQCMSLGYSAKSKMANTIGQYGNGFKTSTMRLGADVIVFSKSHGKDGKSPTKSVGMMSYTFLRSTRKEDIVVPMVDYEMEGNSWKKLVRSSLDDWKRNAETIIQWSPYSSEDDLLRQVNSVGDQGTRIVIYNLWEDDQGELELDFCADIHDIQLGGVNRDEKKIQMAAQFPNSWHFLTYRHSLRSYAAILYLKLPHYFRIILRGKDVQHHNIVNDMMLAQEITYRPQASGTAFPKDANLVAVVKIGFVKDAKDHIDIQGFNVYHKNRLIKPFWRVWNPAGSDGRGVIGVLEANFVEPAHDKQGFERTLVLQRLESKLVQMQKQYWSSNCHQIGYAPRRNKKLLDGYSAKDNRLSVLSRDSGDIPDADDSCSSPKRSKKSGNGLQFSSPSNRNSALKIGKKIGVSPPSRVRGKSPSEDDGSESDIPSHCHDQTSSDFGICNASAKRTGSSSAPHTSSSLENTESEQRHAAKRGMNDVSTEVKVTDAQCSGSDTDRCTSAATRIKDLEKENHELQERLTKLEESKMLELQFERDRAKSLEARIHEFERKLEEANKEQEALIDIFSEERNRRDREEENLRRKFKDASKTIQDLLDMSASASYHSNDHNGKMKVER